MTPDIIKTLKAVTTPTMKQMDVPASVPAGTKWVHKDTGLEFKSRSALKKAIRVTWGKPNPLRAKNRERLTMAVRAIMRENEMNIPAMVRAELKRLVDGRAHLVSEAVIKTIVREEVTKALGLNGPSGQKKFEDMIRNEAMSLIKDRLVLRVEGQLAVDIDRDKYNREAQF